jgi:urease accessory protein
MSDVPILDTRLGNRDEDEALARRIEREPVERVVLDGDQRRRSRFRTRTEAGTEIGVLVGGDALREGDVIAGEGLTAVVELAGREAIAVDFAGVDPDAEALAAAAALGHEIGNRHRDLATRGTEVLVAVGEDDPDRVHRELAGSDELPAGVRLCPETVDPSLFDGAPEHAPGHGHGHTREHDGGGEDHEHDHEHGRGHGHDHERGSVDAPDEHRGPTEGSTGDPGGVR